MQCNQELRQRAQRFLDEMEKRLNYEEELRGMSRDVIVPIHPEIYDMAIETLEIINELGRSRKIKVEPVKKEKSKVEHQWYRSGTDCLFRLSRLQ